MYWFVGHYDYHDVHICTVEAVLCVTVSGVISPTRDLRYECRTSISALVYAKDNYHSDLAGPLAVSLDIASRALLTLLQLQQQYYCIILA
jgi:hypothetical protein